MIGRRGFTRALAAVLLAGATSGCPAMRMRVDTVRIRKVETIAPIAFVGNHFIPAPANTSGDVIFDPSAPTDATAALVFQSGVKTFLSAVRGTGRFHFFLPDVVLSAKTYAAFPELTGANANGAQLAEGGWRYVSPEDGEKIANLLEEVDADAALLTYWHFSLDAAATGSVGIETATPRVRLRAWVIDRDGKVVFDDEVEATTNETIALHDGRYEARDAGVLFDEPITTCAVRMVVDMSNARAKAEGE